MQKADAAPVAEALFVYTTWPDAKSAERVGRALVEGGLAACVNILPSMKSIYRWGGAVETADEAVMIIKTLPARLAEITIAVTAAHPYETPAIAAIPVVGGSRLYIDWIGMESSGKDSAGNAR